MFKRSLNLVLVFLICVYTSSGIVCRISDFKPHANGLQIDDEAFRAALNACKYGGTIYIPNGSYLISPFNMSSNTELYLEEGAILLASTNFSNWPIVEPLPSYPDDYHGGRCGSFIGISYAHPADMTMALIF